MKGWKASLETESPSVLMAVVGWLVAMMLVKGFSYCPIGTTFVVLPIGGSIFALLFLRRAVFSKIVGLVVSGLHILWLLEAMNEFR